MSSSFSQRSEFDEQDHDQLRSQSSGQSVGGRFGDIDDGASTRISALSIQNREQRSRGQTSSSSRNNVFKECIKALVILFLIGVILYQYKKIDRLEQKFDQKDWSRIDRLEQKFDQKDWSRIDRLEEKMREANTNGALDIEGSQAKIRQFKGQLQDQEQNITNLESLLDNAKSKITELQTDLKIGKQQILNINTKGQLINELEKNLQIKEQKINKMEQIVESKEQRIQDLEQKLIASQKNSNNSTSIQIDSTLQQKSFDINDLVNSKIVFTREMQTALTTLFDSKKQFRLLYRASRDGYNASDFHDKCDQTGSTLTIIVSAGSKKIFGVYTDVWIDTCHRTQQCQSYQYYKTSWKMEELQEFFFTLSKNGALDKFQIRDHSNNKNYYSNKFYLDLNYKGIIGFTGGLQLASNCNKNDESFLPLQKGSKYEWNYQAFSWGKNYDSWHFSCEDIETYKVF